MKNVWALVPVKSLAEAKSRLAPALNQAERAALAGHMARDVLLALRDAPELTGIVMLTADRSLAALAGEFGCRVFVDDPGRDLSANLEATAATLAADGAVTVLIVPMDLPTLRAADVSALLAAHGAGVTVAVAARDGGTNALAMTPPDAAECRFGPDSARQHLDAARRRGIAGARLDIPAFARDIDTVDDVLWLCRRPLGGAARQYLDRSGICARLTGQRKTELA